MMTIDEFREAASLAKPGAKVYVPWALADEMRLTVFSVHVREVNQ